MIWFLRSRFKNTSLTDILGLVGSRAVVQVTMFVTGIMIARQVGADGRGLIAVLTAAPAILISISEFGARQSAAYHIGQSIYPTRAIVGALALSALVTGGLGGVIALTYFVVTLGSKAALGVMVIASLMIPVSIGTNYCSGIFLGKKKIGEFNRFNWIPWVIRLSFVAFLWAIDFLTVTTVIASQFFASAVFFIYALIKVHQVEPINFVFNKETGKSIFALGVKYALSLFIITLNYRINTILLQNLSDLNQTGYFSVATNIAELIWQVPTALGALVFAHSANSNDRTVFSRKAVVLTRHSVLVGIVIAIMLFFGSSLIIPFAYGGAFAPSVTPLQTLLPGIVAFIVFKILNMDLAGRGNPLVALRAIIPSMIINVILGLYLIPAYGATGAAFAVSVSYVVGAILFIRKYSREVGITVQEIIIPRKSDFSIVIEKIRATRK